MLNFMYLVFYSQELLMLFELLVDMRVKFVMYQLQITHHIQSVCQELFWIVNGKNNLSERESVGGVGVKGRSQLKSSDEGFCAGTLGKRLFRELSLGK